MEAASIEELHQKIQTLEKEKTKEEEYRNYMQLERVSPHEHWQCPQWHRRMLCIVCCTRAWLTDCILPAVSQDKINAFWEITKKELEDKKAEMRNQDRQTEEAEDMHQRELKVSTVLHQTSRQQQPTLHTALPLPR